MNSEERAEIAASLAAHAELGPNYDGAVAEGLIERIGEEIDKRVDARVRAGGRAPADDPAERIASAATARPAAPAAAAMPPPLPHPVAPAAAPRRGSGVIGLIFGLGSMGLGVAATATVVSQHADAIAQVFMVALIWIAIAVINKFHAQRH